MIYLLMLVGFGLLIKGADYFVDASSGVARRYGIPSIVIGLTIVAFGTSAPELAVNLIASFNGNTGVAIGNILGSNIANIFLILGITAIICPIVANRNTVLKEVPFSLLAALMVFVLANDMWLDGAASSLISRIDGLVLLGFFAIFMYYIVAISTGGDKKEEPLNEDVGSAFLHKPMWQTVGIMVASLTALVIGGKWVVDGAVQLATLAGLTEAVIGLTVVAVGTSLPELVTSVVAARKGETDIAIGNIVGSNIFNIFWILGVSALIAPLPFTSSLDVDIYMTIAASAALFVAMYVGKRHTLESWQGYGMVGVYIAYVAYLVLK
jgi:cation:H+ antiporter